MRRKSLPFPPLYGFVLVYNRQASLIYWERENLRLVIEVQSSSRRAKFVPSRLVKSARARRKKKFVILFVKIARDLKMNFPFKQMMENALRYKVSSMNKNCPCGCRDKKLGRSITLVYTCCDRIRFNMEEF